MKFHGIHTVELPEKRKTKPIDVMQLVNCYFLNEKLRFFVCSFVDSLVRIICTNLLFSAVRVYVCWGGGVR